MYLSADEVKRIALHEGLDAKKWVKERASRSKNGRIVLGHRADGACIYLQKDSKCSIHAIKPTQCRAFPWWEENLRTPSTWAKVKSECPGIDNPDAPLVDSDTIRKWMLSDAQVSRGIKRI